MTHQYVFNGDADGLCALQQLRLAAPGNATLVTGVKRDIALLARVDAEPGDLCTVLDVSLDTNREPLLQLLARGVSVRYFDHHYAGEVPGHANFEAHLDPSPSVCTSLLVDRYLSGRQRLWAIVGTFGDSLTSEATALTQALGLSSSDTALLHELGRLLNYNAYGETQTDLHIPPQALAAEILPFQDPREFAAQSWSYAQLSEGYAQDMALVRGLVPSLNLTGALAFILPNAPWARRVSGTLANDLAQAHPESALAVLAPKLAGGNIVSVRVPRDSEVSADEFCRRFPSGGGRRTAAGVNHLPEANVQSFLDVFAAQFQER